MTGLSMTYSELSFEFSCKLDGAESRPNPYCKGNYLPEYVHFTVSSKGRAGRLPSYEDLHLTQGALAGGKLNKDGKPGKSLTREAFYSFNAPACANDVIEKTIQELKIRGGCE